MNKNHSKINNNDKYPELQNIKIILLIFNKFVVIR